jgi:hypothetical protein
VCPHIYEYVYTVKEQFNFTVYVHMLWPVSQATPNVQCKERECQGLPFIQYTALLFTVHEIVTDWCVGHWGREGGLWFHFRFRLRR